MLSLRVIDTQVHVYPENNPFAPVPSCYVFVRFRMSLLEEVL